MVVVSKDNDLFKVSDMNDVYTFKTLEEANRTKVILEANIDWNLFCKPCTVY